MKTPASITLRGIKATGILLLAFTNVAQAQKLPAIQTTGVTAPKDIKIDGKPTEWPTFAAYNNAIECFYTISSDTENLYLAIQAINHSIIAKIVAGGITFTIRGTDTKTPLTPVTATYPQVPPPFGGGTSFTLRNNKTLTANQLSALNLDISGHVKEIPVTSIKQVADSTVSLYNDFGIKAASLVDHQKVYTWELAIPLKYITQLFDATGTFKYRIQVNGLDTSGKDGTIVVGGTSMGAADTPVSHDSMNFLISPTYLQGSYTLAK